MEKQGIITENTPAQESGTPPKQGEPQTKEAADRQESHPTGRLADAAEEACKPPQK